MTKNEALQEVASLSKGITHDAGQLLDLLGTAAWQAPIPGTDKYVVAGTLAMIRAAAAGTPIAPAPADNPSTAGVESIKNPYTDYRAQFWQAGFDGGEIDATMRGHALAAYSEGIKARESLAAPVAQSTAGAAKGGITSEAFEKIAASWDGCEYDGDDGYHPDIGASLRASFKLLAAPAAQPPAGLDLAKLRALVDAARVCTSVTSMREIVECIVALGEKGGDDE